MARNGIIGKDQARQRSLSSIDALEARIGVNIDNLIREIDYHIKALTPVNTGQAVRNYIWTRGSPNSVVYQAIDSGPVGATNSMALGTEPRRSANEAAAADSLGSLNLAGNPFGAIYLTNNSPDIQGLEHGTLPGPPLRSRSPQGMFGVTESYFNMLVSAKGIMK